MRGGCNIALSPLWTLEDPGNGLVMLLMCVSLSLSFSLFLSAFPRAVAEACDSPEAKELWEAYVRGSTGWLCWELRGGQERGRGITRRGSKQKQQHQGMKARWTGVGRVPAAILNAYIDCLAAGRPRPFAERTLARSSNPPVENDREFTLYPRAFPTPKLLFPLLYILRARPWVSLNLRFIFVILIFLSQETVFLGDSV